MRRRTVVLGVIAVLVLWGLACAWLLLSARRSAEAGAADLRQVRKRASITALVEPSSREELQQAEDHFAAADRTLHSPVLAPLKVLPVAGRHLRASQQLVGAAQDGTAAADDALGDLVALTERPRAQGPERVETLRELAEVADRTSTALEGVDPGEPDALIGPLGRAVTELAEQRDAAGSASDRLELTSTALADLIEGPDPYLLLGANNAEMRNGSGMFLSAAPLRFDQGRMELGDVRPTADLVLPEGAVPAEGDLAANWPWLEPGRDLRNLGLTADFPQSAELAVQNWEQVPGGEPVAGTIVIDVDGLRALLRAVGPVEVDGVRYTPDTVRGELLRRQYQRFEGDREARRDQLGAVAAAVFDRLEAGDWETAELATELADAVAGRHLLVWSTDPGARKAWQSVGADGHLRANTVAAGLINRSASKVDSWVDSKVDLASQPGPNGTRRITLTYDLTNRAPATGPRYLVGPNVDGLEAGDVSGLAVVNLPAGASDVTMDGAEVFLQGGDGPTVVVAGRVTIEQGGSARIRVRATLPADVDRVTVEPSARIPKAVWTVDGRKVARDRRQAVPLGR